MKKILFALLGAAVIVSCATPLSNPSYTERQTEGISVGMDGKETVRAVAKGRDKVDAIQQCMKKAVYDVTFKGITSGSTTVDSRPVLSNPMLRDRYEDYFNLFFADGGDFMQYVSLDNQKKSTVKVYKNKEFCAVDMILVVDRAGLRNRFIHDNILK